MKSFKKVTLFLVGIVAFADAGLLGLGSQGNQGSSKNNKGEKEQSGLLSGVLSGVLGGGSPGGPAGKGADIVEHVTGSGGPKTGSGGLGGLLEGHGPLKDLTGSGVPISGLEGIEKSEALGGLLGSSGQLDGAAGKGAENDGQTGPGGAKSGLGGLGGLLKGGGVLGGLTGPGGPIAGLGDAVEDTVSLVGDVVDKTGLNGVGDAVNGVGNTVGGVLGAEPKMKGANPITGNSDGAAPSAKAPENDEPLVPIDDLSNGPSDKSIFEPYASLDKCKWVRHVLKRLILGVCGSISGATTTLLDNEGIGNIYQAAYISTPTNYKWTTQHLMDSAIGSLYGISGNLESTLPVPGIDAKVDALIELLLPQCGQSGTSPSAPSDTPKAIQQLIMQMFGILVTDPRQPNGFETNAILRLIFVGSNGPDRLPNGQGPDGSSVPSLITSLFGGQSTPQNWVIPNAAKWPITWVQNGQNGTSIFIQRKTIAITPLYLLVAYNR